MLRQRVITAIVLLLAVAGTLAVDADWPFLMLLALACGCTSWEWLRLTLPTALRSSVAPIAGVVVFGLCVGLISAWTGPDSVFGRGMPVVWVDGLLFVVAAMWLGVALPAVLHGRADAPAASVLWSVFGLAAPLAAWLALAIMVLQWSAWFAVTLLITVWVADIAAYFVGKSIGRHKLAPRVSPGKTWEGAAAGVVGAIAWLGLSAASWSDSFGRAVVERLGLGAALAVFALLGALSIAGDLFESLLKRRAGQKDSSQLLPGHGGVYDRIDAILPVAVFGMAVLVASAMMGVA